MERAEDSAQVAGLLRRLDDLRGLSGRAMEEAVWESRLVFVLAVTSGIVPLAVAFRGYGLLGAGAGAAWAAGFILLLFSGSVWGRRLGWGALILGTAVDGALVCAVLPAL